MRLQHLFPAFALSASLLALPATALADTYTYTYTGNDFTQIYSGPDIGNDYTISNFLTAWFTLSAPLPASFPDTNEQASFIAGGITDGVNITTGIPPTDPSFGLGGFFVGTDSNGAIDSWDIDLGIDNGAGGHLFSVNEPDNNTRIEEDAVSFTDSPTIGSGARNANDPGTWVETITPTAATPEPSSLLLLASGLLAFALWRTRLRHLPFAALAAAVAFAPSAAHASVVTFDTGTRTNFGSSFTGSVTEDGFTYSTLTGSLFLSGIGNPGQTMEGNEEFGGGVLNIAAANSGDFLLNSLDFSAFGASGSETITVTGLLNGITQGTDTFTLSDTTLDNPTYANWTTEDPSALAGILLNQLEITLPADSSSHSANLDNVVLTPAAATAATPEPSTLLLLATGLLSSVFFLRRTESFLP